VSGTWHGADLDLYHYTGAETAPNVELQAVVSSPTLQPVDARAAAALKQQHHVMHMTGADAALALGDITVRAETAWFVNHSYLSSVADILAPLAGPAATPIVRHAARQIVKGKSANVPLAPLFPSLDSVEWGIGADTLWHGFQPLLQLNQIVILG